MWLKKGELKDVMLQKVGCDWIFDSDAIEDKCGVCKGDGTKCRPVEGVYNETKITSRKFCILSNFRNEHFFLLKKKKRKGRGKIITLYCSFQYRFRDNEDSHYS